MTTPERRLPSLSVEESKAVAQDAWIFGMPLVYIELQIDTTSHVTKVDKGHAPINQFVHYREFPDASNRTIVGFNVDTLYSLANLDLAKEPLVLSVPHMGSRFWLMQIIDAWNNVPHAPGSRTVGSKGGHFAIVGPAWKGTLSPGLTELRVPTNLALIAGRTYTGGPDDYAAVHTLQDQYMLVPLSSWVSSGGRGYALPNNVPLKEGVDTNTPVPTQVLAMSPEDFFNRVNRLLVTNPTEPDDPKTMGRLATLGIAPGSTFRMDAFTPEVQKAIEEGVANASKVMRETVRGKVVNGWQIALDMGRYGTNYPYRAGWTFFGVGGNLPEDAVYPFAGIDGDGQPFNGANKYTLHFTRAEIPPVNAFWSLTMYDDDAYLVANPINRYALGDRSNLAFDADGGLTLYIQSDSPGRDKESNWLPAPHDAGFKVALRLYAPRKEVADGTWAPPPVKRVSTNSTTSTLSNAGTTSPSSAVTGHGWFGTETVKSRLGEFAFKNSYPTSDTATRLRNTLLFNRAVEAFLVQMHGVSWYRVWKGVADAGSRTPNQVVLWENLMDGATLLLTGNCETVYGLCAIDLKRDGPVVIEAPAMLLGGISDLWQREIMGIGPTGRDKGKGGKFLLLPPDHNGAVPDDYMAAKSQTYGVVFGVRGFQSAGGTTQAVSLMKTTKVYPLSQAANPPATVFVNGSHQEIDTIFSDTGQYFTDLAWIIDREPHDTIPSHERFQLAAIGIEKGRPFTPDVAHKALFDEAARLGAAIARTNSFDSDDPARLVYPDRVWEWAFIGGSATWDSQGYVNTDRRSGFAYIAIGMSPAMVEKHVGAGSQYLWTPRDASGAFLDGGKRYRLHIPPNIPAKNFWSVVAYDADSRSILRSGQPFPSVSTYTGPAVNADGSIDIDFGPEVPTSSGGPARNWIQTTPTKGWFALFRFYGPLEPFFDQTWKPDNIVEVR